jgi:hypothetical protein
MGSRSARCCYLPIVRIGATGVVPATVIAFSCTETPTLPPCVELDATCVPYMAQVDGARVPAKHRPSSSACPKSRGSGALSAACSYDAGPPVPCLRDSDCTTGVNGRCLPVPPIACDTACSYDQCFADSDCGHSPCECRGSSTDSAANLCLVGSNCQLDADCADGGYCSPSATATCSTAYFCHTAIDKCIDDVDCPSGNGCNYDPSAAAWTCSVACSPGP